MICKKNSYSWWLCCQSKLTWDPRLTSLLLPWLSDPLPVPESVGQYLLPAEALPPRTSPTYRTNLFPLAIKLCFVIGFLKAPGFTPFRHLDAILKCSPEGKKGQLREEGIRGWIAVARCSQETRWAENRFQNVSARLHPLTCCGLVHPHHHPSPHS